MTLKLKRRISYALLATWMVVIFLFSSQVADTSSAQSAVIVDAIKSLNASVADDTLTFLTRKGAHMVAYFILGMLAFNILRLYSLGMRRMVLISIVIAASYAMTDEVHQLSVAGRSGEVRDVLLDTTAAGVGVMTYYYVNRFRVLSNEQL